MTTFKPAEWPRKLRSQHWYGGNSRDTIYHRGWLKNQGYPHDLFDGRPVIGILNTWSELTPCNAHLHDLAQRVKHGIFEAGGFPVEVPVFSAAESSFRPSAMMFRNLAAMAVEEAMRGQPIDGAGVTGGGGSRGRRRHRALRSAGRRSRRGCAVASGPSRSPERCCSSPSASSCSPAAGTR